MAKGLFSQCLCLLTDGRTAIEDVRAALEKQGFEGIKLAKPQKDWRHGGPTLVFPFLPDVNGYAAVDLVDQPWPDAMADEKADPKTYAAWEKGHFGPLAYSGGLARAGEHSSAWESGRVVAAVHSGFIRLRTSYVFGTKGDKPVAPKDYDPLAELSFLSRVVLAVLEVPGVICYFNPNGEVLRDAAGFREMWDAAQKQEKVPLPLWTNVRFFNLPEKVTLMDTVGNGQLDLRDVEAVFPKGKHSPGDIDRYLRRLTGHLLGLGRKITTGEDIDGPGESNKSWTTDLAKDGTFAPPRRVVRVYPKDRRDAIQEALAASRPR
jgi:hypothetical protein